MKNGDIIGVTGAAGFIGSHVTDRLLQDGYTVVGFDNLSTGTIRNIPEREGFTFILGDVTDKWAVMQFAGRVDAIIHLAAVARTQDTIDDPFTCHETNITGTLNLLEASRATGVKRFVHGSSSILYAPHTPYYVSKLAAESYASIYPELYGLSTISLRYANVYGSRQSQEGAYPNVLASFARDKKEKGYITIYGDGSATRDFVHVSDAVEASILALKSFGTGVYDVGTGKQHSIQSVAERFDCPIRYEEPRKGDVQYIRLDTAPAYVNLGFDAKVRLEDGIKDYL